MKRAGIREVQIHLTSLLKNLPFKITRFGKVIAIVSKPSKPKEEPEKEGEK